MKKYAEDLAKDYELGEHPADYYQYIVDSLENGQRQQVRSLFNQMHDYSKEVFLNQFLEDDRGIHVSTKTICIQELLPNR